VNQLRYFVPMVVFTDDFQAKAFLNMLAKLLADEYDKPYSTVRGFIDAYIIAILLELRINALEVLG